MHKVGLIHRDIKPDNITLGPLEDPDTLYLIDFGLSIKFYDIELKKHIVKKKNISICGTLRYCSRNTHSGLN